MTEPERLHPSASIGKQRVSIRDSQTRRECSEHECVRASDARTAVCR